MATAPTLTEFDPKIGSRPYGLAAAVYNGQLWVIGGDGKSLGGIATTTLSMTVDPDSPAVQQPANWQTHAIAIEKFEPAITYARCGLAGLGGDGAGLYLAWNEGPGMFTPKSEMGRLYVSRYYDDGSTGTAAWHAPLALLESDGATVVTVGNADADVSATAWGGDTLLVACANVKTNTTNGQQCLYLGVYNTADMDVTSGTWAARWHHAFTAADLQGGDWGPAGAVTVKDLGAHVSMDWVSTGAEDPNDTSAPPPYYLYLFVNPDSSQLNGAAASFLLPLAVDASGVPTPQVPARLRLYVFQQFVPAGTKSPPTVIRDPAGRLTVHCFGGRNTQKQETLHTYTYTTSVPPGTPGYSDAGDAPFPNALASDGTGFTTASNATAPAVAHYIDLARSQPVTVDGKAGTGYPTHEFLLYGGTHVMAQVVPFGTAEVLQNFASYQPCTNDPASGSCEDTKYIISGIFDSPMPVPNQNIVGFQLESDNPGAGTVSYAYTTSTTEQNQSSFSLMGGFKSSGAFTKGIGPAWDIAFSAGPGSVTGSMTGTSQTRQQDHPSYYNVTQDKVGTGVQPLGLLSCATAHIETTAYRFIDAYGNVISDATSDSSDPAPKSATFTVTFTGGATPPFTPYAVIPGDLDSYMPDGINATMQDLGYQGADYFGEVIVANAYTFPDTQLKYFSLGWGTDGHQEETFQATSSSFTEQTWSLQNSDYAGVSGGGGASLFGEGFEMSWSVLAGVTISKSTQSTTTSGFQWGIKVSDTWGPPSWGDDSPTNSLYTGQFDAWKAAMAGYTFLLYFLPVPPAASGLPANAWTQELITYLPRLTRQVFPNPTYIDSSSGAWRICYAVTQYTTNEDYYINGKPYTRQYSGPLT